MYYRTCCQDIVYDGRNACDCLEVGRTPACRHDVYHPGDAAIVVTTGPKSTLPEDYFSFGI